MAARPNTQNQQSGQFLARKGTIFIISQVTAIIANLAAM
jgi:hypothetical protein